MIVIDFVTRRLAEARPANACRTIPGDVQSMAVNRLLEWLTRDSSTAYTRSIFHRFE